MEPGGSVADSSPPEEELVGNAPPQKNWKGIVIALGVIVSILALISIAIVLMTDRRDEFVLGDRITFTEAMTFSKHLRHLQYQWVSCSNNASDEANATDVFLFLNASTGDLMRATFSQTNGSATVATLLAKDAFSQGRIGQFVASPDCSSVLIPVQAVKRYRHSSFAKYLVVRVGDRQQEVTLKPQGSSSEDFDAVKLQVVTWGPSNRFIAFVHNNNVYYSDDPFTMAPVRITNASAESNVACGVSNWVYEEEILQTDSALWVSPENERIAYITFNDTRVLQYHMPWYGQPGNMYVQQHSIRYPKAGSDSPLTDTQLLAYDVKKAATFRLRPPRDVPPQHYVTLVRWFNSSHLLAAWIDRRQVSVFLAVCDATRNSVCKLFYSGSQPDGWIDFNKQISNEPIVDAVNERIFIVLHNNGYRRIASVRVSGLNQVSWVSPSAYDVADVLHFDAASNQLHFLSCRESSDTYDATKMHLHRIAAEEQASSANCISCTAAGGGQCDFNAAAYSLSGRLLLQECLGPRPFQYFVRLNHYPDGYPILLFAERNEKFSALLAGKNLPRVEFRRLTLRSRTTTRSRADPVVVNVKLTLPRQLNETHISQYPLVFKVYAGPTSQMVTRKFDFGWQQYLASSLFVISASVDGRGTGNRGSSFLFAIKNSMAGVELQDQMDALAQLRQLQYVNRSCVSAFGWSYGGFIALHMLGHPANTNNSFLATAVAVAPVTDFDYYNSGYTERYLGVKSDETAAQYKRTNASRLAANFWNKDLLLVHGTGDDNVHFQNSAQFVKALVAENVDFEFMTYADEDHSMRSSQLHLFQKITTFLVNSFNRTSSRKNFLNSRLHKFCSVGGGQEQC